MSSPLSAGSQPIGSEAPRGSDAIEATSGHHPQASNARNAPLSSGDRLKQLIDEEWMPNQARGDALLRSCQQSITQYLLDGLGDQEITRLRNYVKPNGVDRRHAPGLEKLIALRELLLTEQPVAALGIGIAAASLGNASAPVGIAINAPPTTSYQPQFFSWQQPQQPYGYPYPCCPNPYMQFPGHQPMINPMQPQPYASSPPIAQAQPQDQTAGSQQTSAAQQQTGDDKQSSSFASLSAGREMQKTCSFPGAKFTGGIYQILSIYERECFSKCKSFGASPKDALNNIHA